MESAKAGSLATQRRRRNLSVQYELLLAAVPTATILLVLAFVEVLSRQRLLFASLASSAFLIYLDPEHGSNRIRTLLASHGLAATFGLGFYVMAGPGYLAAGGAMVSTIVCMIVFDVVHPPAVASSLAFAFRAGPEQNWIIFMLAVCIVAVLLVFERLTLYLLTRLSK